MSELLDDAQQEEIEKTEEEKKQSELLARREARRRRILENAKSRLDKLSGTERNSTTANKSANNHTEIYSNPEIDHPECMNNYYLPKYTTKTEDMQNETPTWDTSPLLQMPAVEPPTRFEQFLNTRIHIVAASTITYTLLALGVTTIVSQSLFGLFLLAECLELLRFHREKPLNPIVNMVLLLSGLNVPKAGVLIKLFCLAQKILTDLGLFVFSFVISHGFYCLFVEGTGDQIFTSF